MNKDSLKEYLSSPYKDCGSFLRSVIFPIFGEEDFEEGFEAELLDNQPERRQLAEATGIRSIKLMGKIYVGVEPLQIFDITVRDRVRLERNRVSIQRLIRAVMDQFSCAFMVFHYEDLSRWDWRFTFCRKSGIQGETTSSKRFTFLLGPGQSCRTATDNFMALYEKRESLEMGDIENAFSVEALTRQFYKDLFEWYLWATNESANVTFPNSTTTEDDDREDIEKKVIRMITRVMFVWFIKQKDLVPARLFDVDFVATILKDFDPYSTTVGNYYNAILQNLFFATLNRAAKDEEGNTRKFATSSKRDIKTLYRYAELFTIGEQEVIDLFAEVPFLNGGLFECLDKTRLIDGVEQGYNFDGFSRNDSRFADGRFKHRAVVPNVLFFEPEKGLIAILSRYNFTIEENSPEEQKVALDPELLGKVFENLLGAYTPETKETARNQSGSFYTPREIVNYMVDEALIAYLGGDDFARSLFGSDFVYDQQMAADYRNAADKLKAIKVLDPACGSGAFPMGLLNRLVDILLRISPNESVYDLKLSIIENCIYGSDIQSIAAQITKLRFFISLICDCEKDDSKPNFGIPTLPNLETKFVSANSLIAKKKKDRQGCLFENPEIELTKNELTEIRHRHFSARSASTKSRLREKDQALRVRLAKLLSDDNNFAPDDARQLAEWNPYDQNSVSPFFDPEWMFGVAEGFDIVIGNPPYVQLQNNGGELAKKYEGCGFSTFARTGDIYCLFYERGWQLLKKGGHLCYITSNKWMRAGYGEKTREFLATKTDPQLLIDFAGVKIFESATVDTNILMFEKAENRHRTRCAVASKQDKDGCKNLSLLALRGGCECDFGSSEGWVVLSPIEQGVKRKIEAVGTPLREWDIQINYGIKTGYNDAFIISTARREEILSRCRTEDERRRTEELIRPILRGRDIKRYGYEWANLWLIYLPWHFPYQFEETIQGASEKAERAFMEQYPAVYSHMLQYKEPLSKRNKSETGIRYEWYAMQRWGAKYWGDFLKPKIVWGNLNLTASYCMAPEGMFVNAPSPMIATSNRAVLHVLNSKLADYYIRSLGVTRNGGYFEYKPMFVQQLPIPKEGTNEIAAIAETPNDEQQKQIDQLVYKLYNLSEEEIQFIESQQTR